MDKDGSTTIHVHNESFWIRIFTSFDIGCKSICFWNECVTTTDSHFNPVSESYMEQEFTCSPTLKHVLNVCLVHWVNFWILDLHHKFQLYVDNNINIDNNSSLVYWIKRLVSVTKYTFFSQSRAQSIQNVSQTGVERLMHDPEPP